MEVYHRDAYQRMDDKESSQLGCCGCLEKWFLGSVNFLLFIVAVAEIGCGLYVMTSNATTWTGSALSIFIVSMGVCVALIAFLGCCGAFKENKCMLWTYAFMLFWIILAQTVGLTICAIGDTYTEDFLSSCWNNLSADDQAKIEDNYKCCSFNGNSTDSTTADQAAYATCLHDNPTYVDSCWEKVHGEVSHNLKTITFAVGIVVVAQIVFLFVTMALINGISMAKVNRRMSHMFRGI